MFLRSYYATLGDRKEFTHSDKLHRKHSEIMLLENKAQGSYTMLSLLYSEGKTDLNIIYKDAASYYLVVQISRTFLFVIHAHLKVLKGI